MRKGFLRNLTKFTGQLLRQSLSFNEHEISGLSPSTLFIKKENLPRVFSCKFCEISKSTFFKEHHWTTASVHKRLQVVALPFYLILSLASSFPVFFHFS